MNSKQAKFCQEYIKTTNATQSAIKAGYSKRTAKSIGQRLLTFVDIKNYINELQENIKKTDIMTAQERMIYLSDLIMDNNIRPSDKLKAMDILNKMTGEYTQKINITSDSIYNPFSDLTLEELKKLAN